MRRKVCGTWDISLLQVFFTASLRAQCDGIGVGAKQSHTKAMGKEIASAQVNFSSFKHYRMYFFGYSCFYGLRNDAMGVLRMSN